MPEPFKNIFNPKLIDGMAQNLARVSSDFKAAEFAAKAKTDLDDLEMMARADQISFALDGTLVGDFEAQVDVLVAALHPTKTSELSDMSIDDAGIAGWAIVAMGNYIVRHGMTSPDISLRALREMTMRFSTEFAVRPFIQNHQDIAMKHVADWSTDENHHVRRLASEGTRPLLPWGIKLHAFVSDPNVMLPILTALRDDPSDYVRRSVANHLNDISKNHPDLIAELATDWLRDAPKMRERLVKHACRGLIKAGHSKTLGAFGYGSPRITEVELKVPNSVKLGDAMPIELSFRSETKQKLLIDYVLYFMRANGKLSAKVFKWTEQAVSAGEDIRLEKVHPYRKVTTRKDYPGQQKVAVQINGQEIAQTAFEFLL